MQLLETAPPTTSFRTVRRAAAARAALAGLFVAVCLCAAGVARAEMQIDFDKIGAGTLLFAAGGEAIAAPTVSTDVRIRVSGIVARVRVSQTFHNDSARWLEGVYVFPLPETAAVDRLRMRVGRREIVGEIREREKARREYEKARDSGRKASLIEQQRPNVFTNAVANIGPGESVLVEIEYQQRVDYDDGAFSVRFPMAVTPRYRPERGGAELIRTSATTGEPSEPAVDMASCRGADCGTASIAVTLDAGFPIAAVDSPYHAVDAWAAGRFTEVTLRDGRVPMERDFELAWRALPGSEAGAAVFTETVAGERYAMVMFVPPAMTQPAGIARELVLVIDRSGSMAGPSIRQARAALAAALERLSPRDRFNIVAFGSTAGALFPEPEHAEPLALQTARAFVDSLEAGGGTNMRDALALALRPEAAERAAADGFLRQVVFITDGAVDNEEALFRTIDDGLGASRLFTVGIGPAPNGYFMRKAARFGRGSFTHVGDLHEIGTSMESLLRKLEAPALTDLEVRWPEGALADASPTRLPDLYAGEPVVVSARLNGPVDAVRVRGGAGWERRIPVASDESPGVGVLYARERIAGLMDERVRADDRAPIEQAITRLALRHHIVSRFTSLVAVDRTPARPVGLDAQRVAVPTPVPAVAAPAMLAAMPIGATNAQAWMLMGAMFVVVPLLLTFGWRE